MTGSSGNIPVLDLLLAISVYVFFFSALSWSVSESFGLGMIEQECIMPHNMSFIPLVYSLSVKVFHTMLVCFRRARGFMKIIM